MGAATTSLAVFEEGDLLHFAVFPIGSANITNDIAIGLRTEIAVAESIKKQHGTCIFAKTEKEKRDQTRKKIEIFDKSSSVNFTKKGLVDIIEPRVSEIFDLIQKELKKINRQELLPAGVILTGGGAKLPRIKELAKQQLKLPCDIGTPKGLVGLEDDPALSTVAGLVLGGAGIDDMERSAILGVTKGWGQKIRRIFRIFLP
jgi:cell division protein FtsA